MLERCIAVYLNEGLFTICVNMCACIHEFKSSDLDFYSCFSLLFPTCAIVSYFYLQLELGSSVV